MNSTIESQWGDSIAPKFTTIDTVDHDDRRLLDWGAECGAAAKLVPWYDTINING
jgi:hypothetical protein